MKTTRTFVPFWNRYIHFLCNGECGWSAFKKVGQHLSWLDFTVTEGKQHVSWCNDGRQQRRVVTCRTLMAAMSFSGYAQAAVIAAFNIASPRFPAFSSSLVIWTGEEPLIVSLLFIAASSSFQIYIFTYCYQVVQLLTNLIFLYMFTMNDLLTVKIRSLEAVQLRLRSENGLKLEKHWARLRRMIEFYRFLQLLTHEINDLFAAFLGLLHGAMVPFLVLCCYGCLRTEGMIAAILTYVAFIASLAYLTWMNEFAAINLGSKSLLRSLNSYCRSADGIAFGLTTIRSREAKMIWGELKSLKDLR